MKLIIIAFALLMAFSSCFVIRDRNETSPISFDDIKLGMEKEEIIRKLGKPFSFRIWTEKSDTISEYSYKTGQYVAGKDFIVTTTFSFVNNRLKKITQDDFYATGSMIYADTTQNRMPK